MVAVMSTGGGKIELEKSSPPGLCETEKIQP